MNNILGLLIWGVLMMAALSMWPQNAAGRKDASQIMNDGGEKISLVKMFSQDIRDITVK